MSLKKAASNLLGAVSETPKLSTALIVGAAVIAAGYAFHRNTLEEMAKNNENPIPRIAASVALSEYSRTPETTFSQNEGISEMIGEFMKEGLDHNQSLLASALVGNEPFEKPAIEDSFIDTSRLLIKNYIHPLQDEPLIDSARKSITKTLKPSLKNRNLTSLSENLGNLSDVQFFAVAGILQRSKFAILQDPQRPYNTACADLNTSELAQTGVSEGDISYLEALTTSN